MQARHRLEQLFHLEAPALHAAGLLPGCYCPLPGLVVATSLQQEGALAGTLLPMSVQLSERPPSSRSAAHIHGVWWCALGLWNGLKQWALSCGASLNQGPFTHACRGAAKSATSGLPSGQQLQCRMTDATLFTPCERRHSQVGPVLRRSPVRACLAAQSCQRLSWHLCRSSAPFGAGWRTPTTDRDGTTSMPTWETPYGRCGRRRHCCSSRSSHVSGQSSLLPL